MFTNEIANLYERDIRKLIEEVDLFKNEADLWKTHGSVKNPSGNLVLHIIGGLNHLIGAVLAKNGYLRNRDSEFNSKGIKREYLVAELNKLIVLIDKTVNAFTAEQMEAEYPIFFDKANATNAYVLFQLLLHLNYHLGQINYLRRMLE